MDEEIKGYLESLRQDLTEQIAASSAGSEQVNAETRLHAERLNAKSLAHAEHLSAESLAHTERLNAETRADLERFRAHADDQHTWARILIENLHHDVRLVAEGVKTVNDKLDRIFEDHEMRIKRLEERMP